MSSILTAISVSHVRRVPAWRPSAATGGFSERCWFTNGDSRTHHRGAHKAQAK